jgi:ZIP family zinc transporter
MMESLLWGLAAAASLLIGALLAMRLKLNKKVIGVIMAFGVGVLISAIAFELTEEAFRTAGASASLAIGLAAGALTFFVGDWAIDHMGGHHRKSAEGKNGGGSPMAIVLGSVLDGIPESIVIGLSIVHGGAVGIAMLVAVFLSNLPESIGATSGLLKNGWHRWPVLGMWALVVAVSGLASLAGFALFDTASPDTVAFTLAFSAGALLTMLADTMMPEAYDDAGSLAGIITTLGFGIAFWINILD